MRGVQHHKVRFQYRAVAGSAGWTSVISVAGAGFIAIPERWRPSRVLGFAHLHIPHQSFLESFLENCETISPLVYSTTSQSVSRRARPSPSKDWLRGDVALQEFERSTAPSTILMLVLVTLTLKSRLRRRWMALYYTVQLDSGQP